MLGDWVPFLSGRSILPVVVGFILDFYLGDPSWLIALVGHPVIYMGKCIHFLEGQIGKLCSDRPVSLLLGGGLLLFLSTVGFVSLGQGVFRLAYGVNFYLGLCLESLLCFQLLATRSLIVESRKVYQALEEEGLSQARVQLSYIVGRDTAELSEEAVIRGAVETVAENTTDGVVAPLCYMFCFGALGGLFYKVVNTLDSMVGYRNEKYLYFGRCSAKMDDVLNWIPSRLTAWVMMAVCGLLGHSGSGARKIFLRDRYCHKSPNSAQTESVVAGALGIQLGGSSVYFGKLVEKPTIGDALRPVESEDILRVHGILKGTAWAVFGLLVLVLFMI